jgi:16S rRNA processing protein RimM
LKTIQRKDFIEVGSVVKVHGTKGELKIALTREIKLKEWAFLEFRGKPVPFYIESTKADLVDEVILKLQGIGSIELANPLIGAILLLPKQQVKKEDLSDDWNLDGYIVKDMQAGILGKVEEVIEYPYQSLAKVIYNEQEILIPLVDEIIVEINDKKKELSVNLPEGLLHIN